MQEFTNSHLSYDQIIADSQILVSQQPTRETRLKLRPQKYKPFWIQRNKQMQQTSTKHTNMKRVQSLSKQSTTKNRQHLNPEEIKNHNREGTEGSEQNNYQQNIEQDEQVLDQYESDFQFLEEDVEESIIPQVNLPQNININKSCQLKVRKNKNYSAVLPRVPNRPIKLNSHQRQTMLSRESHSLNNVAKSTIELREENKKLVQDIETFRKYLPIFKRNNLILNQQDYQLSQMKQRCSKFFDINYELSLDKNVEGKVERMLGVQGKIKQEEKMIKNPFLRNKTQRNRNAKISLRISRIDEEEQCSLISQFAKIREHVLSKKREQQHYERKIEELQQKINQYNLIISDLQQRSKVGIHEDLKRKKIVLEYDIQMKKTQIQQKQCQLMLQIAQLNNKSSQLQIQVSKISGQLNQITHQAMSKQTAKKEQQENEEKTMLKISDEAPPKKSMTRLFKLFGRKK